jgi:hypothetical protein
VFGLKILPESKFYATTNRERFVVAEMVEIFLVQYDTQKFIVILAKAVHRTIP